MKNFLLTLMSVSKEISLFKTKKWTDKIITKGFLLIHNIIYNNVRIGRK